jgi:hypothetical protein
MNINVKTLKMAYKRWCYHSWLQVVTEPNNKYMARGTEKTVHTVGTKLLCLPLYGLHLLALCHNSCPQLMLKFLASLHQHVNLKDITKSSTNHGQSSELWESVYYIIYCSMDMIYIHFVQDNDYFHSHIPIASVINNNETNANMGKKSIGHTSLTACKQ